MENNKLSNYGYTLFRVGIPALMLLNGQHKLEQLMAGGEIKFMNFLGLGAEVSLVLAVIGEVVAPLFLIVGFKTRVAAIPAIITMFVAAFVAHAGDPLGEREHSLLYLVAFVAIAMIGSGSNSIDAWFQKRKSKA
ncbi:MAG: hypothetical protein RLZZ94_609 [Bacteroidota bacterium]|jgi:putative oxidoreductase